MPMTVTLRLIDFLKCFSTCLNSSERDANGTRLYCISGDIRDQWLGTLELSAFFPCCSLEGNTLRDLQQKKKPFSVKSY